MATELPNVVGRMEQKNVVAAALGAHSTCHKTRYGGREIFQGQRHESEGYPAPAQVFSALDPPEKGNYIFLEI